jgi:hypothetical protein
VTGTVGDTTTLEVAAADAATAGTMPAIGILGDTLAANATGHAVVGGELTGLATGSYSIGQALYVAAGGGLTGTKPTTGTVQQVAIVGRVHASTGSVTVTIGALISPNWDTAYSERLRWDGGATGLDAATGRTSLGLGDSATRNVGTTAGTVAAGDDSRITGALSAATAATTYQPLDADLTSIAALTTTVFGRSFLTLADAAAGRTSLELGSLATQSGTFSGTSSGTNTGDVTLAASVADVLSLSGQELQADDPGADRLLFWDDSDGKLAHLTVGANLTIAGTTISVSGMPAAADAAPLALGASAVVGTSTDYAREDHVHVLPTAGQVGAASTGAITGSGLTMATAKLLGRTTASTGAIEEITVGTGLSLTSGTLTATGGGGGLTHFVESESTASPNTTVPVDALTATDASYTNIDVAIVAKGTGATLAQVPTNTTAGGNKRGTYATDLQKNRTSSAQVASEAYSTIGGGYSNTASGSSSIVGGGDTNTASSQYTTVSGGYFNTASDTAATVGGGDTNTASGIYSIVGGGRYNTASSQYSTIGGGDTNTASGRWSVINGGRNNTASGFFSTVSGGQYNTASGSASFVGNGYRGTTRSITGYHVFPACVIPIADADGITQSGLLLLARETTGATATVLASTSSSASTTNQVILPNNSAYSFSGEVIAGVTGAGNTARWTIAGAIKRGASAATTVMVGTPTVTMTHNDAGASAWTVAVTANTTLGCIKVEVTGATSTTIRWVCKIETTEMTF